MYTEDTTTQWNHYLETPRKGGSAMKLDRILRRRMRVFLKARQHTLKEIVDITD